MMIAPQRDPSGLLVANNGVGGDKLSDPIVLSGVTSGTDVHGYPYALVTYSGVTLNCSGPFQIASETFPTNGAHCLPHLPLGVSFYSCFSFGWGSSQPADTVMLNNCAGGPGTGPFGVSHRLLYYDGIWTLERVVIVVGSTDNRYIFRGHATGGAFPMTFTNVITTLGTIPADSYSYVKASLGYGGTATVEFIGCGSYASAPVAHPAAIDRDTHTFRTYCEVFDVVITGTTAHAGTWRLTKSSNDAGVAYFSKRYDGRYVQMFKSGGVWWIELGQPASGAFGFPFTYNSLDVTHRDNVRIFFTGGSSGAAPAGPWVYNSIFPAAYPAPSFTLVSVTSSRCWDGAGRSIGGSTELSGASGGVSDDASGMFPLSLGL